MTIQSNTVFQSASVASIKIDSDIIFADVRNLFADYNARKARKSVNQIFDEMHAAGKTRHGFSTSTDTEQASLWNCWKNICNRTSNPNHPRYKDYGARGIQNHFKSFEEFARCVEFRPGVGYSIDRIDNEKGYEPGNLRWSTIVEQNNNTRRNKKAH
ncbi:hypothetical protein [Neorhizobium alkalisoli]|uniref:Uncharacterized protein n=1 Tax=Neorhizobium alkalisoli TaxID=528178 RepID=A0A561R180_9HYPH|nr:hypothetical protein [Neorhizobium alkalisoli]TWF56377.1 hypothetical protein FHW37_1023 [Neorhizobium alkalisoli]